jgi:hypothetical protein
MITATATAMIMIIVITTKKITITIMIVTMATNTTINKGDRIRANIKMVFDYCQHDSFCVFTHKNADCTRISRATGSVFKSQSEHSSSIRIHIHQSKQVGARRLPHSCTSAQSKSFGLQ